MKITLLALAVIGLMVRGYFMYQANQIQAAKQTLQMRQTVDAARHGTQGPDAEADAAARGKGGAPPKAPAAATNAGNNTPTEATQRQEIEASLRTLHVTTIMPGQPGMVIVDKQDYSEGEELPLGKGRKAKIVTVQDDGVQLTCSGMTFHLDAPAAPDLAASRKKK